MPKGGASPDDARDAVKRFQAFAYADLRRWLAHASVFFGAVSVFFLVDGDDRVVALSVLVAGGLVAGLSYLRRSWVLAGAAVALTAAGLILTAVTS